MSRDRHPTAPGRRNVEPRTSNVERRTSNLEPRTRLPFAVACLLLAAGSVATAQEAPPPEPTPLERSAAEQRSRFDYGGFAAPEGRILPAAAGTRWTLSAGVGVEYSDNPHQDETRDDGFRVDGTFGVGWTRRSPRLVAVADYRLSSDVYRTGGYDDQSRTTHALAGSAEWQASRHLRVDGSGFVTQEYPEPFEGSAPGVRTGYGNRTDSYGADLSYDWRLGRASTNDSYYRFRYTDYLRDDADGTDSVSHFAGTGFRLATGPRDGVLPRYDYRFEEDITTDVRRQNHMGELGWEHTFAAFPAPDAAVLGAVYAVDRGLYREGEDYWSQSARATYAVRTSPRTDWTAFGGYQWVDSDGGASDQDWIGGVDVTHRFSPRTTGTLGAHKTYEYVAATDRTAFSQLTKTKRVMATVTSRWTRTLSFRAAADYMDALTDAVLGPGTDAYWQASGDAELSGGTEEVAFWGVGYREFRRQSDHADDDYHLFEGRAYLRRALLAWLDARLTYRHARRYYDRGSTGEDYFENLVRFVLEGRW